MGTIQELAQIVSDRFDAFTAAKTTADASTAQAAADQALELGAQTDLDSAIQTLVSAAEALDPSPVPVPSPATAARVVGK